MQLTPVPPQRHSSLVIPEDRPVYRIKDDKGFFASDDCLYPEGSIIALEDEPNLEMEPLNSMARDAMRDYLNKLDEEGKKVAAATGKSFNSLADAFDNARDFAKQGTKKVELLGAKQTVPLMGAKKRGRPRIQKIEQDSADPVMGAAKINFDIEASGRKAVNKVDGS